MLEFISSRRFLRLWTLFYVCCLAVLVADGFSRGIITYGFCDMFINYSGGFVRRGLLGSLFLWGNSHSVSPVMTAVVVCGASFVLVGLYLIREFRKRGYAPELLTMCFLLGGVGVYGLQFLRRDFFILLMFLIVMLLRRRLSLAAWLVVGNVVSVFTILCYEPFAFFSLPFFVLATRLRMGSWVRSALCWLPSAVCFLVCCKYSGDGETYRAMCASTHDFLGTPGIMDFIQKKSTDVLKFHLKMNFLKTDHFLPNVVVSCFSIMGFIYYMINAVAMYARDRVGEMRWRGAMLLLLLCGIGFLLPMFLCLSTDYARLLIYVAVSALVVRFTLSGDELLSLFPKPLYAASDRLVSALDRLLPPSRLKILFVMMFVGVAAWTYKGGFDFLLNCEVGVAVRAVLALVG